MRTLSLFFFLFLFAQLSFGQVSLRNSTNYQLEKTAILASEKLELDSIAVIFRLKKNDGVDAYTKKLNDMLYVVFIAERLSPKKMRQVVAHEIMHVKQLKTGELIEHDEHVEFHGETISLEMPYSARPYEKEAIQFAYMFSSK